MNLVTVDKTEYCSLKEAMDICGTNLCLNNWTKRQNFNASTRQHKLMFTLVRNELIRQFILGKINAWILSGDNNLNEVPKFLWLLEQDDITLKRVEGLPCMISFKEGTFIILPEEPDIKKCINVPEEFLDTPIDYNWLPSGDIVVDMKQLNTFISSDCAKIPNFLSSTNDILDFYFSKQIWTLSELIAILWCDFSQDGMSFTHTNSGLKKYLASSLGQTYFDDNGTHTKTTTNEILQELCNLGYEFRGSLRQYLLKRDILPTPSEDSFIDAHYWLLLDKESWTLEECAKIICKIAPDNEFIPTLNEKFFPKRMVKVKEVYDLALRHIKNGTLECCDNDKSPPYYISAKTFLEWADGKFKIPKTLKKVAKEFFSESLPEEEKITISASERYTKVHSLISDKYKHLTGNKALLKIYKAEKSLIKKTKGENTGCDMTFAAFKSGYHDWKSKRYNK